MRVSWPRGTSAGTAVVVGLCLLALLAFILVEANLDSTILALSKVEARQLAIGVVTRAIEDKIVEGSYGLNLFRVQLHGHQAIIQPDTAAIDQVAARATLAVQQELRRLPSDPVYIPLGQALGSKLLASYGPMVPVVLIPYGALNMNFQEEFHSAGINQTLLVVYLDLDTMVQIVVPLLSSEEHVQVRIPIAQEWYAGPVPQTYVGNAQGAPQLTIPIGRTGAAHRP